ncbi:hypothetical protein B0H21DRAFT_665055, partial [Amylocystis lapponica]
RPGPSGDPLTTLVLESVQATPHTIILNLGKLFLQIQLHTHTMAQVYNQKQWDDNIGNINCDNRKFRVGLALDFGEYVLAFLTLDNLIMAHWATSFEDLPHKHVDVYTDNSKFLKVVGAWVESRCTNDKCKQDSFAVIVDGRSVFGGVGVYTVIELFFLAGLSVFLMEHELFSCPSRIARLCAAFYAFAHRVHTELACPHYHGWVLAATRDQRLRYTYHLYVYGKARTNVPLRMASLCEDYIVSTGAEIECGPQLSLFDVFEPSFISVAMAMTENNLGHLIFGVSEWEML